MDCFNGDYSTWPRVDVTINGQTQSWLNTTGASRTYQNLEQFKALFPQGTPRPIKSDHANDDLHGASGKSLGLHGMFYLTLKVMNRTVLHEVCVC